MHITNLVEVNVVGALRGMRNPLMSHEKSTDESDVKLVEKLIKAGPSHRKFLRQCFLSFDIVATTKFFLEFDTYEFVVSNSSSMMHLLGKRFLVKEDFEYISKEMLKEVNKRIKLYQDHKNEATYLRMLYSIPQGFLYTRTVTMSFEVFITMYATRKNHKLKEWRDFCEFIRSNSLLLELAVGVLS